VTPTTLFVLLAGLAALPGPHRLLVGPTLAVVGFVATLAWARLIQGRGGREPQ